MSHREKHSLHEIVISARVAVEQSRHLFETESALIINDNPEPLFVYGIFEYLQMMVEEPLRNALEYAPDDSTVVVEIRRDNEWGIIAINDRGPGILEEDLDRVWDRFDKVQEERLPMSALYLPLIGGSRVQGVLSFQSYQRHAYSDVNNELISTLATQAAVTLANALLHQETQTHADTLKRHVQERTRELESVNQRMFSILHNATDGILLVDQLGNIEVANRAFDRLFGYDAVELVGRSLLDITFDAYRGELRQAMKRVRETGKGKRLQIKCLRKDRTTFDGELSLVPVTSDPQHDHYLVCTLFDISKFKSVERMKDQFIATINHEIRTPITEILLSADTLANYYERLSEEQRLRKIEQIKKQGRVLVDLINATLDLARLEDQESERGSELVDMSRVVTDACAELRSEAEIRQQRLELRCRAASLYLIGTRMDLGRTHLPPPAAERPPPAYPDRRYG